MDPRNETVRNRPAKSPYPARFIVREQRPLMASKDEVLASVENPAVCTINALPSEQHQGTTAAYYGRPGHIKGSVNGCGSWYGIS